MASSPDKYTSEIREHKTDETETSESDSEKEESVTINGKNYTFSDLYDLMEKDKDLDTVKDLLNIDSSFLNVFRDEFEWSLLYYAVASDKNLPFTKLFIDHGADISLCDSNGRNAVHYCGRYDSHLTLSFLLTYTDDQVLNKLSKSIHSPLWLASFYGGVESVRVLLLRNVDTDVVSIDNGEGFVTGNAYDVACAFGIYLEHKEEIQQLILGFKKNKEK